MNEVKGAQIAPDRQQHHVALCEAMQRMHSIIDELERLRDEVAGENAPPTPDNPNNESITALAHVLEHGPNRIHEQCDRLQQSISAIRRLLF